MKPSRVLLVVVVVVWWCFLNATTLKTVLPALHSSSSYAKFLQEEEDSIHDENATTNSSEEVEEERTLGNFFDLGDGSKDPIVPEGSEALAVIRALNVTSLYSDTAYIRHCNLTALNLTTFHLFLERAFSLPLADQWATILKTEVSNIREEIILQGLELYSRAQGICNYAEYTPTVPVSSAQLEQMKRLVRGIADSAPPGEVCIIYAISVFDDVAQLERLLQDIYLPQHLIILHVERRAAPSLLSQLETLAARYGNNLLILKYGTVMYASESLSKVFIQIMRLVTMDLQLPYDYFITLSASTYPLWEAHEMARHLYQQEKRVRIGRMIYKTRARSSGAGLCRRIASGAGIILSQGMGQKRHFPVRDFASDLALGKGYLPQIQDFFPKDINRCTKKTNSGNTAAYDREAVQALLTSPSAMDLLSRFKQSGSCCSEEVSWGAALAVIGRDNDVDQTGMIWQSWACPRGKRKVDMHNTILRANKTNFCVKVHDSAYYNVDENKEKKLEARTIRGYVALEQELKEARSRGHLFLRKFVSEDTYWINWIQSNLHNTSA